MIPFNVQRNTNIIIFSLRMRPTASGKSWSISFGRSNTGNIALALLHIFRLTGQSKGQSTSNNCYQFRVVLSFSISWYKSTSLTPFSSIVKSFLVLQIILEFYFISTLNRENARHLGHYEKYNLVNTFFALYNLYILQIEFGYYWKFETNLWTI